MLKFELRKLFCSRTFLLMMLFILAGCIFTNLFLYRESSSEEYKTLAQSLGGPLSMENYAALTNKVAESDPIFGITAFDKTPFDSDFVMTRNFGNYSIGEKVNLKKSPIGTTSVNTNPQKDAASSLWYRYDTVMRFDEIKQEKIEIQQQTLAWFAGKSNFYTRKAERTLGKLEALKSPTQFSGNGAGLLNGYFSSVWSLLFVLIMSSLLAGTELQNGVLPLTNCCQNRKKILYTKLSTLALLTFGAIAAELLITLLTHTHFLFEVLALRIQNFYPDSSLNLSVWQALLMNGGIKFLILTGFSWILCFLVRLFGDSSKALAFGGILAFLPVVLQLAYNMTDWNFLQTGYLHSLFVLTSSREYWSQSVYENVGGFPLTQLEFTFILWSLLSVAAGIGYLHIGSGHIARHMSKNRG